LVSCGRRSRHRLRSISRRGAVRTRSTSLSCVDDRAGRAPLPGVVSPEMSEENVELVRRVYEAAAARDVAAVFELYDEQVELDASRLGMFSEVFRGHDGLRKLFADWHEAWGKIEYSYEELIAVDDDRVISVVKRHARGRASGVDVEHPFALLWTVRDGRVTRVAWFLSRDDALEAAGRAE
jgi:ketosteroid isomerase-like protein